MRCAGVRPLVSCLAPPPFFLSAFAFDCSRARPRAMVVRRWVVSDCTVVSDSVWLRWIVSWAG